MLRLAARAGAAERHVRAALDVPAVPGRPGARGLERWKHPDTGDAHRHDGPAIHRPGEYEAWFINGVRHRVDGPAVVTASHEVWWRYGERHRLDGPASQVLDKASLDEEDGNGREWWVDGAEVEPADGSAVLDDMYDAGRIDRLQLVLAAWRPGGPNIAELAAAVEAATA